jgi:uncharacterized protein (TIGR00725 family)
VRVSVVGGGSVTDAEYGAAREIGRLLGEHGHVVVCGGLDGVMEAACRGASEAGGETVGILPGSDCRAANEFVDTPIATGMGHARNALVVLNSDATIAVDGGPGTLSEVGHALALGRPVAGLDSHDVPGAEPCEMPREAVEHVQREV